LKLTCQDFAANKFKNWAKKEKSNRTNESGEVEVERLEYGRAGVRVILKNSSAVGFTGVNHPTPPCATVNAV
jgi:hypothetical protein